MMQPLSLQARPVAGRMPLMAASVPLSLAPQVDISSAVGSSAGSGSFNMMTLMMPMLQVMMQLMPFIERALGSKQSQASTGNADASKAPAGADATKAVAGTAPGLGAAIPGGIASKPALPGLPGYGGTTPPAPVTPPGYGGTTPPATVTPPSNGGIAPNVPGAPGGAVVPPGGKKRGCPGGGGAADLPGATLPGGAGVPGATPPGGAVGAPGTIPPAGGVGSADSMTIAQRRALNYSDLKADPNGGADYANVRGGKQAFNGVSGRDAAIMHLGGRAHISAGTSANGVSGSARIYGNVLNNPNNFTPDEVALIQQYAADEKARYGMITGANLDHDFANQMAARGDISPEKLQAYHQAIDARAEEIST